MSSRGEGMHRMDANACALESSRSLRLSHAQGFKSKSRTAAPEYSIVELLETYGLQKMQPKVEIWTPKMCEFRP